MSADLSPEERAVEVLRDRFRKGGMLNAAAVAEHCVQALSAADLHITDQPGQDELHEAQMEAEHYRELWDRRDITDLTGEDIEMLQAGLGEIEANWINPPGNLGALSLKLRRLSSRDGDQ